MKRIQKIVIEFIPHSEQRYNTCGDWLFQGENLVIRVSETQDQRSQQLVAVHELCEALACNVDGVTQESVDAFDMGPGVDLDEPGSDPAAPYHEQHEMAEAIERRLATAMLVDWDEHEAVLGDLSP